MHRFAAIGLLLVLAACSNSGGARYSGTMTPDSACGSTEKATLVVVKDSASFAANDGAVVVPATVGADGKLSGQHVLLGGDKKPFPLAIDGTVTGDVFTGTYTTPRCRFSLLLTRVRLGLFGGPE